MQRRLITRAALVMVATLALGAAADPQYEATLAKWRKNREAQLTADDGWLTVAGLFWLKAGTNRFGTDPSNDIVLPRGSAPATAGSFQFDGSQTRIQVQGAAPVTVNGKPVSSAEIKPDTGGAPDIVRIGDLSMFVIKRGGRFGIRLRDKNSERRRSFGGLRWYPVKDSYRVTARFVPYSPPRKIPIINVLGDVDDMESPGYVEFMLGGQKCQLAPVVEGPKATELFFILRDQTSGVETYPAGRFLYTDLPKNGEVVLDFNMAVNPPCAFTSFATCPLPPKQNQLPLRVEAGEMYVEHK
jgi:uncharacterized protein